MLGRVLACWGCRVQGCTWGQGCVGAGVYVGAGECMAVVLCMAAGYIWVEGSM